MIKVFSGFFATSFVLFGVGAQASVLTEKLAEALREGEAHLNLRMRYETVAEELADGGQRAGDALTLKTRINFQSAQVAGISGFLEFDDVSHFAGESNDGVNGKVAEPLIADPVGTEVNQAFLAYSNWDSKFKYGRQRLVYDNHRFIGHVAWRQNEQTYDAFTVVNNSVENLELNYAYIFNVNRIFGEASAVGDAEMSSHLINASYTLPVGSVAGYAYLLESDDNFVGFNNMDTQTYGLRWQGGRGSLGYILEYAIQESAGENPGDYSADYLLVEASYKLDLLSLALGYEALGADREGFFVTPLATLFKFQGWTDTFVNKGLGNISEGVNDSYLSLGGVTLGVNWLLAYHRFESGQSNGVGDSDLGSEFGGMLGKRWGAYSAELRYARYSAGDSTAFNAGGLNPLDTEKMWLTLCANF